MGGLNQEKLLRLETRALESLSKFAPRRVKIESAVAQETDYEAARYPCDISSREGVRSIRYNRPESSRKPALKDMRGCPASYAIA
ncbi:hypothetical protein BST65_27315 [Bradyrhizobium canariense]|nr:hypothetical protein BST65_27315 [Bradyrhizobium canariense]OSI26913.1 hypothetical protein BST66_36880 [Bradyrhizobium canariense]